MLTRFTSFVVASILVLGAQSARSAVNDVQVKSWIAASLLGSQTEAATADALIDLVNSTDAEKSAWLRLKRCRDAGDSLNLNLAAAEHYMFMRFSAGSSGDTNYAQLPRWYETLKRFAVQADLDKYLQTSSEPVSQPDADVTRWGGLGVQRGLQEYQRREGRSASPGTTALQALVGYVYAHYYYQSGGSPGSCDLRLTPFGTWESTDAGRRWLIQFSGNSAVWTERVTGGPTIRRTVLLQRGGADAKFRLLRENDTEVLTALGFSPAIRTAVLARSPRPSFLTFSFDGVTLTAEWQGILVIKDNRGQFRELRQPEQVPSKHFDFSQ